MLCKVNEDGSLSEVASNGGGLINDEKTSENETWSSKKINDSLVDLITVDEYITNDMVFEAPRGWITPLNVPQKSGYTAIGIVGGTSGFDGISVNIRKVGEQIFGSYINTYGTNMTTAISIDILYQKTTD